eukprot:7102216-Alexandrium_andersonii.AAC.1
MPSSEPKRHSSGRAMGQMAGMAVAVVTLATLAHSLPMPAILALASGMFPRGASSSLLLVPQAAVTLGRMMSRCHQ